MSTKRRLQTALALIAVVALISACGATSTETAAGGSRTSTSANARKAVRFAECMRSNGVGQFPDPGSSGSFTIDGIVNGSSLDPNTPTFTRAISACKNLEPSGFVGTKQSPGQMSAARRFAQCIRANGVTDFPDPVSGQPLVDTNRIPSSATSSGMSALNAAMHKCGAFAEAAGAHK